MKVLLVDKSKSRLQKLFPAQEFFSYEKIDDFTYNKIDEAIANSLPNSTFYYGQFVDYTALESKFRAFILWIPGKGKFFKECVLISPDQTKSFDSLDETKSLDSLEDETVSIPFIWKVPGFATESLPTDLACVVTIRGTGSINSKIILIMVFR